MIATKWPRLLVVGQPVTVEQADEILIRTNAPWWQTNDRFWGKVVADLFAEFGKPREPERDGWVEYSQQMNAWAERVGILDLHYLHNDRIMSSWIGGPHGWCDWDGTIGCSTYNIGKWPSTEEVTEDWAKIAQAFPYLDLTAQLLEEEGEGALCGQWRVRDGAVEYTDDPTEQIRAQTEIGHLAVLFIGGERGVSLSRLRSALVRVTATAARREDGES